MNIKLFSVLILLLGIFTSGCVSQTLPDQTNQTGGPSITPVSHSTTSIESTPTTSPAMETVTPTPIPANSPESDSGKSQYLAAVNAYLENISTELNSIKKAKSLLDYPALKNSADQLEFQIAIGDRFSYRGNDPSLIKIDAMFPLYRQNLIVASSHYYVAGSKGIYNETATYFSEIKVGDAYYYQAMETGHKIIHEMKQQNISISKNIQDAHGIWFSEQSVVYT